MLRKRVSTGSRMREGELCRTSFSPPRFPGRVDDTTWEIDLKSGLTFTEW